MRQCEPFPPRSFLAGARRWSLVAHPPIRQIMHKPFLSFRSGIPSTFRQLTLERVDLLLQLGASATYHLGNDQRISFGHDGELPMPVMPLMEAAAVVRIRCTERYRSARNAL